MQLAGTQFTNTSALVGNDIATFPDFPAEIRAPRGTLAGVSGFQVHFSSTDIYTPGDTVDALVAMNPAALATNLADLRTGGILIVNSDAFDDEGPRAGRLRDQSARRRQPGQATSVLHGRHDASSPALAVEGLGLGTKEADRCRNFFAMGLVFWLYDRPLEPTLRYIDDKFGKKPEIAEANRRALQGRLQLRRNDRGVRHASSTSPRPSCRPASTATSSATQATGLRPDDRRPAAAASELFLGAYPITPASDILHELAKLQELRRAHVPGRGRDRGHDRRRSAPPSPARWRSPPPAARASRSRAKASAWP